MYEVIKVSANALSKLKWPLQFAKDFCISFVTTNLNFCMQWYEFLKIVSFVHTLCMSYINQTKILSVSVIAAAFILGGTRSEHRYSYPA